MASRTVKNILKRRSTAKTLKKGGKERRVVRASRVSQISNKVEPDFLRRSEGELAMSKEERDKGQTTMSTQAPLYYTRAFSLYKKQSMDICLTPPAPNLLPPLTCQIVSRGCGTEVFWTC